MWPCSMYETIPLCSSNNFYIRIAWLTVWQMSPILFYSIFVWQNPVFDFVVTLSIKTESLSQVVQRGLVCINRITLQQWGQYWFGCTGIAVHRNKNQQHRKQVEYILSNFFSLWRLYTYWHKCKTVVSWSYSYKCFWKMFLSS